MLKIQFTGAKFQAAVRVLADFPETPMNCVSFYVDAFGSRAEDSNPKSAQAGTDGLGVGQQRRLGG